jgi:hypothetical protein
MQGAAADSYNEYKLIRPVGDWSQFIRAMEEKNSAGAFSLILGCHVVELSSPYSSLMAGSRSRFARWCCRGVATRHTSCGGCFFGA